MLRILLLIPNPADVNQEHACFEEQMDVLRQDMEPVQFQRIWNSGSALTMEQALGFALGGNYISPTD